MEETEEPESSVEIASSSMQSAEEPAQTTEQSSKLKNAITNLFGDSDDENDSDLGEVKDGILFYG